MSGDSPLNSRTCGADVERHRERLGAQPAVQAGRDADPLRQLAHPPVARQPGERRVVRERADRAVVPRRLELLGRLEPRRAVERVEHLLGGVLRRLQRLQPRQLVAVLAVQPHDLARRVELPQVGGGVVAERRQLALHVGVALRRRVEVDAGVGRLVLPEGGEHALQVADAHVVGDEREVVAAQLLLRDREVARGAGQRLGRVVALVDRAALALQLLHARRAALLDRAADLAREAPALRDVDLHAEQVLAGLGEDLRQPDGALGVAGHRVLAAGALEEHERLEHVGGDAGLARRVLDLRAPARDALRRRGRAARRAGVEDVARAGGGAPDELVLVVGVVGERVGDRRAAALLAGRRRDDRDARRRARRRAAPSRSGDRRRGGCPRARRRGRAR